MDNWGCSGIVTLLKTGDGAHVVPTQNDSPPKQPIQNLFFAQRKKSHHLVAQEKIPQWNSSFHQSTNQCFFLFGLIVCPCNQNINISPMAGMGLVLFSPGQSHELVEMVKL